jgi:glycosyltransferase involved in cell wall biosynthesis
MDPVTDPVMDPDVDLSVVIPCHDEASTLPAQLDALGSQSWAGTWEVIVVDNASEDDTAGIARAHAALADRLRVVRADAGRGVSYARRAGVEASSGRAIVFCDGDDVVGDGWVQAMGDALREHALVTGEIDVDLLNEPPLVDSRGTRRLGVPPRWGEVVFLRGNNGGMAREVWDALDGFDEGFHGLEDIELSLRAAARGMFVHFEPSAVVHYRYRDDWRGLWRQGLFYGRSEPMLDRRCRELGLVGRRPFAAWRSWAWLLLRAPGAITGADRPRWLWTLACRVGALDGLVRGWVRRARARG